MQQIKIQPCLKTLNLILNISAEYLNILAQLYSAFHANFHQQLSISMIDLNTTITILY